MAARFEAVDAHYAQRVRDSFARQAFMGLIGAGLSSVEPGRCAIALPTRDDLTQQHGYVHAGIVTTLADNAAGYAAYSLMPADCSVLTVELKINLLAPARGEALEARAEVLRAGRSLTVAESRVFARRAGGESLCATALITLMAMQGVTDRAPV